MDEPPSPCSPVPLDTSQVMASSPQMCFCPPSPLLHNMTPNNRKSAAASQDVVFQQSRNSEVLSQELLSQNSNLSTSKHIHPDRLQFGTPNHGRITPVPKIRTNLMPKVVELDVPPGKVHVMSPSTLLHLICLCSFAHTFLVHYAFMVAQG
uniref:Uncharacterized protein n=1 Tax=Eutreptiella gymnastica TaxID=73025 RepID=A0A7S1HY00_9EUGL|mmetsp:Transcript_113244/g.196602  ORF Transcript_113244/g.196602 Transcript_113244/m.196602 type:complete len:151 (+) Transcript_113244:274-726(+)